MNKKKKNERTPSASEESKQQTDILQERISSLENELREWREKAETIDERLYSEEQFRTLFETMGRGVVYISAAGKILAVNPAAERILRLDAETITKRFEAGEHERYIHEDGAPFPIEEHPAIRALKTGTACENEVVGVFSTPLNDFIWLNITAIPQFRPGDEKPYRVCIIFDDISKHRNYERALRESEERFARAFQANPSMMAISRYSDETYVMANDAFLRTSGYSREEVIGKRPVDLNLWVSQDTREDLKKRILAQKESVLNMEVPFRIKSGGIRIGLASADIFEMNGEKFVLSVVLDITERKLAEEALRKSEEKFAKAFRSSPVAMSLHSFPDLKFMTINDKFCEMTGFTSGDVIGKDGIAAGLFENPRVLEDARGMLRAAGSISEMRVPFRTKGGNAREGLFAFELLGLDERETVLVSALDTTDIARQQEDRLKVEKLESIGILAGGIAHDFNNLLMAILGNISLVKMEAGLSGEARDLLTESENAVMRAKDLTQQLLTFARGGTPVVTTVSLRTLLRDATEFALRGSNVKSVFEINSDLLPAEVDTGQINQVIHNLVINAMQSMPSGGILTIRARNAIPDDYRREHLKPGKYLKIEIQDEGMGIPKEHLQKIFDPYFTTKEKGSGLGLATAYSIIKNHRGYITVDSAPGSGANFTIYLPASDKKISPSPEFGPPVTGGKGRVLIMDDEEAIRKLTETMLVRSGYEVTLVADGNQAVAEYQNSIVEGNKFNVVIMDLTIPGGMGGKDAIARLRNIDPDVKAVVSSGYSTDPIMSNFREFGFSAVIAKPYRMSALTECVDSLTNVKES